MAPFYSATLGDQGLPTTTARATGHARSSAVDIGAAVGAAPDLTAPAVTVLKAPQYRNDSARVRVTDAGGLKSVVLLVQLGNGAPEWVYADVVGLSAFSNYYRGTKTAVDGGFDFEFTRYGGWPDGAMEFYANAFDNAGNQS